MTTTPADAGPPAAIVAQLTEALRLLGRPVTVERDAPSAARVVHLARLLVAVAEQHTITAERAVGGDGVAVPTDVGLATSQAAYDKAAVRAALERLTLALWRAQRLAATVEALRADMTRADPEDEDGRQTSALAAVWGLAAPAAAAVEGLLELLARLTIESDPKPMVDHLDAATRLLVHLGAQAGRLRAEAGLDERL